MDTYGILREFADSWFLLAMFGFFIAAAIYAMLPSQRRARDDAALIPFKDDPANCSRNCATCGCKTKRREGLQDG